MNTSRSLLSANHSTSRTSLSRVQAVVKLLKFFLTPQEEAPMSQRVKDIALAAVKLQAEHLTALAQNKVSPVTFRAPLALGSASPWAMRVTQYGGKLHRPGCHHITGRVQFRINVKASEVPEHQRRTSCRAAVP